MKIFSAAQIRHWDAFTIKNEPITSIDLMERAATACANSISQKFNSSYRFKIFCGQGNNGGDGLAIARLLIKSNYSVSVFIVETGSAGSPDFETNFKRLDEIKSEIHFIKNEKSFPEIKQQEIVVDALFGTGLNKSPHGIIQKLIGYINKCGTSVISIDVPSGLYIDSSSAGNAIIRARYTLTFQQTKLAFLLSENEEYIGEVVLLDIKLSKEFIQNEESVFGIVDKELIQKIYVPRKEFANKGNYGYACLLAGSYGMMGAAELSASACLRSGVGKLTAYICKQGYSIMQTSVPEAMCKIFGTTFIKDVRNLKNFDVIGIGPGIGQHSSHKQLLQKVFKDFRKPIVIDADALNVLSENHSLYKLIPLHSIITPHPKEFERLFGETKDEFERINLALKKAKELNIFIVLKGHHTLIAAPNGNGFFNSTGNAGMATAGSGDVLTGILTGLIAQKYSSLNACILGVYLHGMAGDIAAKKISKEAMIASDIINHLGDAFKEIDSN